VGDGDGVADRALARQRTALRDERYAVHASRPAHNNDSASVARAGIVVPDSPFSMACLTHALAAASLTLVLMYVMMGRLINGCVPLLMISANAMARARRTAHATQRTHARSKGSARGVVSGGENTVHGSAGNSDGPAFGYVCSSQSMMASD